MALDVMLQLETVQERRGLSSAKRLLRATLKKRVMALTIIERARKRQVSKVTNLKVGDANTKFFHDKVNGRKRKNFVGRLLSGGGGGRPILPPC